MQYRVISIGTLAAHPLWDETSDVRTGHATTTLISSGDANLIVDPSLPPQALAARMGERTNVKPEQVTDIFLTTFEPERRRAIGMFEHARWLIHEPEAEAARDALRERLEEADDAGELKLAEFFRMQLQLLERCEIAEDVPVKGIDLFPLPGVTPGCCGLLLALPGATVLVCGDAVATAEHLEQGKVLSTVVDVEKAKESFREAVEIADVLIPGRDNILLNPLRRLM